MVSARCHCELAVEGVQELVRAARQIRARDLTNFFFSYGTPFVDFNERSVG